MKIKVVKKGHGARVEANCPFVVEVMDKPR